MSKLTKKIATIGITVVVAVSMTGAASAALTQNQIDAIITLLESFGAADAATVANVRTSLSGGTPSTGGTTATACSFTKSLTLGSTGDDVKCLQQYLNAAGYPVATTGVGSVGNETTYFGTLTQSAVASWQAANSVTPSVGYFGPISRAKYTAVAGTTGGTVTTVPGVSIPATGLAVTLAADNPAASILPGGAAGVEMLKFNVAGSGTVSNITVKRTGAGKTTDFSNVYLYRGSERLTSGRSVNSSTHEANFTGLNLAINGVVTLRVVGDVSATATPGDYNAFRVISVSTAETVTGLPISGNEFGISGASAGTITARDQSDGLSNPSVGQADAEVFRFKLTTADEDMKVSRISVFYGGALSSSELSSLVLKDLLSGNTLATATGVNVNDLVVFDLTTPYELLKGDNRQFSVHVDIDAGARSGTSETLIFYFEEATDILAVGNQYGYGATVVITDINSAALYRSDSALTLETSSLVISFLGPNAGNIAKNVKDITLFEFKASAISNIEVRNLRFTVTASTTQAGVDDFKVVDVDSGVVVSGPTDDATGSTVMTDDFTIPAGVIKHYKVTGDTDTNWLNGETIQVTLAAFTASTDLKNVDNNTFLANADVVPNGVAGNTLTLEAPTLTIAAATLPASDSFVKGTSDIPFLGISLRASADTITVTSIKVSASATSGSLSEMASDVQSVALYEGLSGSRISDIKSWTTSGTPRTITFSNLNFTIAKGDTKNVVVKANLSSSATSGQVYAVVVADTSTDITSLDSDGNSPTLSGSAVNNAAGVKIELLSGGSVTVARAADDTESEAGVIVASANASSPNRVVLGKFDFTAANEAMIVNKLNVQLDDDTASSSASTEPLDNILGVYLYEGGGAAVGSSSGYIPDPVTGIITIENLDWTIAKDSTKKLVVKADMNSITAGADTGDEIYVHVRESGFEASGAVSTITTLSGASVTSREKVVYKSYPSITTLSLSAITLPTLTDLEVARFKVTANNNDVEWASIGLQLQLTNASGTDAVLSVDRVSPFASLDIATQSPTSSSLDLTAGAAASVILQLITPEHISSGNYYEYIVKLNATALQFGTANETETLTSKIVLHNDSSTDNIANAVTRTVGQNASTTLAADATLDSSDNAFVWSDRATTNHNQTSSDWANGVYVVKPASLSTFTRSNSN